MQTYDLSVLIPARNEMFLAKTVENILENKRGNTEILVALDGAWADPGLPDHPDVTILYLPESIGQRAATNQLARLSTAKYVMKLDAHCAVDEGFDVKMIAEMKDDYTLIPAMYNLHAFDWVCNKCGNRWYQGPKPKFCCKDSQGKERNESCDSQSFKRKIVWKPRQSRLTKYWRFDKDLHFQYWGGYEGRPESIGDVVPIFSAQGSCFMLTREKYWELDICDEGHGSWGQQGVEVACKTWLSGGKLMVNKKTWYSHMFRTQQGFGFPYPMSGTAQDHAKKYSQDMWLNDKWPKAIHPFSWLIEKFRPIPDWHDNELPNKKLTKGVIYYTHNVGDPLILEACRKQLAKGMKEKHIVSASNEPIKFGRQNLVLEHIKEPKFLDMFEKILATLKAHDADIIFFAEHDVLYHPKHFDFTPKKRDVYYYNTNVLRVRYQDGHTLYCKDLQQLSGLVAYRETLIKHFEERVKRIKAAGKDAPIRGMGFEPGSHGRPDRIDDLPSENYFAKFANLDIRHDTNSTASRWSKEEFRNQRYTKGWTEMELVDIPGWHAKTNDVATFLKTIAL